MAERDAPTVWAFEDQLHPRTNALVEAPPDAPVLLVESRRNFRRVPFHKKRIGFLVSAMRHFAAELRDAGRTVAHYPLAKKRYRDSLSALAHHFKGRRNRELWIVEPSEYHTRQWLDTVPATLERDFKTGGVSVRYFPNRLFLTDRDHFAAWLKGRKKPVMEHFYRQNRAEHGLLMDEHDPSKPEGGVWNLDKQNRKPAPRGHAFPPPHHVPPDAVTLEALRDVEREFAAHPGTTDGFGLPCDRSSARAAFAMFVRNRLPLFGDYEDAMVTGERALYHSLVSAPLNAGLLSPLALCRTAEKAYRQGVAPLNAAEGFIRQIVGWREYVYGVYWSLMPDYRTRNARNDNRPLPDFFWDGETDMNCLRHSLSHVIDDAFSHHIQRLMVICNFATLAGLNPQAVNDWFYAMYVDSHDWVVTPNVIGMAMNADGDVMATKPYVSSAAYIDRMSDYCGPCRFDPKQRTGDDACPFNYLYWTFLEDRREHYDQNPRMRMVTKNLDRFAEATLADMRSQREQFVRLNVHPSGRYKANDRDGVS